MNTLRYLRYHSSKITTLKIIFKKALYVIGRILFFWKRRNIPYSQLKRINKILFISLYFRGDVLFQTPVIKLLKELFPDAQIDAWVKPRAVEVLKDNQDVNEILDFDSVKTSDYSEEHLTFDLKGKWSFFKKLRSKKYDLIVDYTGLYATSLFTLFAKPRYSVGKNQQGLGFCYNNTIDIDFSRIPGNLIVKYIDMLAELLIIENSTWKNIATKVSPSPIIYPNPDIQNAIRLELKQRNFDLSKPLICIHLTAGWEAKRWGLQKFKDLIEYLLVNKYEVAVVGGEYDKSEFQKIISEINPLLKKENLEQRFFAFPLQYNAELIKMSDIFIGSDSAPLHIAGAVSTPSIGLFGPTNPTFSNPIGENHIVAYKELWCSAKFNEQYCLRNAGKTCSTVDCMKLIEVAEIVEKIDFLLKTFPKPAPNHP